MATTDFDGQLSPDKFIEQVISIDRLRSFRIDMSGNDGVLVSCEFWKTINDDRARFSGYGRTIGLALDSMREKIALAYGR